MERTIAEENKKNLEFIEEVTTNVDEVQKRVLDEILTQNANVEYLQRLNLNGHTERETFKKVMPGDFNVQFWDVERGQKIDTADLGKGKGMNFMFIKSETKTPGGLLARPVFSSIYKSRQFRSNSPYANYTSPIEAILCLDSYQIMFSQILCGLCQNREVVRVGSAFASGFIRAMRFLEDHWSLLCNDIRTGTINDKVTDPSVREAVMKILKPDSELADFIEAVCSKDSWKGIITRLWPNTKYVNGIMTGSMSQYIPTLDYYSNSLPIVSAMYASSECFFGLYRYRVGDVLRVAGYKNNALQFNFICRENVILSIDSDKTNEIELQNAVKNGENNLMPFNARVTEYMSYADTATIPGHYVLFWELSVNTSAPVPPSVFEDCCLTIEESLNSVYRLGRASNKFIGPLKIRIVKTVKLMHYNAHTHTRKSLKQRGEEGKS
ncbi:Indole-3-acetic acid-amido synthetase GH3.5 [Capsicum annuum]|nr:Indole-3-acetic acid-amido synthetase GH3.5 [Capsicum annuum]